jgi:serine/threonine protein kinase
VILARSPEGRTRAVITDFGLARVTSNQTGEPGSTPLQDRHARGTHDYMAPERFLGEPATVSSDIYALGVLFHVMLTGHGPRRMHAVPPPRASWTPDSSANTRTAANGIVESDWQRDL